MFRALVFWVVVLATWSVVAAELFGRTTVTDGDTLTVAKKHIRLWGIDAPESTQQCSTQDGRSWPCGRRSAAALDGYLLDKTVSCEPKDTDLYGRVVAECCVQGQSVNRWMVHSGWAVAYRQYTIAFVADKADAPAPAQPLAGGGLSDASRLPTQQTRLGGPAGSGDHATRVGAHVL